MNAIRSRLSRSTFVLLAAVSLLSAQPAGAEQMVVYKSKPGSSVKIEGTSTMHDWTVEGKIIGGSIELPASFPADPSVTAVPTGKIASKLEASIPVRSIRSGKSLMDSVMHEAMKEADHPRIGYKLTELTVKEPPAAAGAPIKLESKGELTVAGVTKPIEMPVTLERIDKKMLKFAGTAAVKMTDFGIKPPAPALALGAIKTGDDVRITFEWLAAAPPPAPEAAK